MSSTAARPDAAAGDVEAARRLADALDNGGWLQPIDIRDAPLDPGEGAYADLLLHGWRYHPIDVRYEQRTVMFGGPLLFTATAIGSWAANCRRRREAERLAAPQWRPLGTIRTVVTPQRLLVWHWYQWWSVWFSAMTHVKVEPDANALDLFFESDPPYRLAGSGTFALEVALRHFRSSS